MTSGDMRVEGIMHRDMHNLLREKKKGLGKRVPYTRQEIIPSNSGVPYTDYAYLPSLISLLGSKCQKKHREEEVEKITRDNPCRLTSKRLLSVEKLFNETELLRCNKV